MTDVPRRRILLVEDDALSLKLMRDVLAASGYDTDEVMNGLEVFERAEAADLIVMDIGLPGLDGIEVTRRLKDAPETRGIPVVAVTAYAMPEDERRVREAGCDMHLSKPLNFAAFISVVRALLGDREAHEPAATGTET